MAHLARFDPRFMVERVVLHVPREVVALFCAEPASHRVRWDPSIRALGADGALETGLVLQPWAGVPEMVGAHHTRCPEWKLLKEVLERSWAARAAVQAMTAWEVEVDRKEPPKKLPPAAPETDGKKQARGKKLEVGVFFAPVEKLGKDAQRYQEACLRRKRPAGNDGAAP